MVGRHAAWPPSTPFATLDRAWASPSVVSRRFSDACTSSSGQSQALNVTLHSKYLFCKKIFIICVFLRNRVDPVHLSARKGAGGWFLLCFWVLVIKIVYFNCDWGCVSGMHQITNIEPISVIFLHFSHDDMYRALTRPSFILQTSLQFLTNARVWWIHCYHSYTHV